MAEIPDAFQEAMRTLDAAVRPFQCLFRWRGEHHEEASGIRAVLVDQCLRVDAIALGLGHGAHALEIDRLIVGQQLGTGHLAMLVVYQFDFFRCEILDTTLVSAARKNMIQHHALGQQVGERLVVIHQTHIAHDLAPEARVEQMQNGMLDAADVLVNWHPVVGLGIYHGLVAETAGGCACRIACVIPAGIDEGVHRVGFAFGRFAALGASAVDEIFALVERVAGAVRYAVFRQFHRQLVIRHRHVAAVVAVDDGNRATPVALTRDTPVTQAPVDLLVAQALGLEVGGDGIHRSLIVEAIVFVGVDANSMFYKRESR